MREHKHLRKIRILLDAMYIWRQVGAENTTVDTFNSHLNEVENIRDACTENPNYKIQPSILSRFNNYYKQYNTKMQWTTAN
jgi:hypothetical protein